MCDKSCWEEHPRDVIDNSIRELGAIADMLQGTAIDSGVLADVHPGDLGILLSGLRDRQESGIGVPVIHGGRSSRCRVQGSGLHDLTPRPEVTTMTPEVTTMTRDMMAVRGLLENSGDGAGVADRGAG